MFNQNSNSDTQMGNPIVNPDTHWYSDDEIIALLHHFIGNHPEVAYLDPMLGNNWGDGHNTLRDNLRTYHIERGRNQEMGEPIKNKIIIPVNLNHGHWVLIYVIYPENTDRLSQIYYFDPKGEEPPRNLREVILSEGVFSGCEIINIGQRVQDDEYNCGVWVVEAARAIAYGGAIPDHSHNIFRARNEHSKVVCTLPSPQESLWKQKSSTSSSSSSSSSNLIQLSSSPPVEKRLLQDHLLCPILQERMRNPVIAADGYTYEREAIIQWIATRGARAISPMTGERLVHLELQDNTLVRQMISAYEDTKPQRQQRVLTEHDILLAIKLREEELTNALAKQDKAFNAVVEERNQIIQKLEPQAAEIERLRQEVEYLRKAQNLPEDKIYAKLHSNLGVSEKQLEHHLPGWAASIIQLNYHRHRLKQMIGEKWLHREKKLLLKEKEKIQIKFAKEESVFKKRIATLAKKAQFEDIKILSQDAQEAQQKHSETMESFKEPLKKLEQDKTLKREQIIRRTIRFHQTAKTKQKHMEAMNDVVQDQQQTIIQLGIYTSRRAKEFFKFQLGALKTTETTNYLHAVQMELQNQLTHACYGSDLEQVKELVKKGADPAVPDKDGQQPLAAAIWGLAFEVMDYLESKVKYTEQDWQTIAVDVQKRHNILVPASIKIVTYGDWLRHYESKECDWFYNYNACEMRETRELQVTWKEEDHVQNLKASQDGRVELEDRRIRKTDMQNKLNDARVETVDWLRDMCEAMASRLGNYGIQYNEYYQLIIPSDATLNPSFTP